MNKQNVTIVWGAMCLAPLVYAAVFAFGMEPSTEPEPLMVWTLAGMNPVMVVMGWAIPFLLPSGLAQTPLLIRWAMFEAGAVFGFVVGVLGGPLWLVGAMMAFAWMNLLLAFPRDLDG